MRPSLSSCPEFPCGSRRLGKKSSTWGKERIGQALAFLVALLGLLTLSEFVFGWDLGIDQLLAREAPGASMTSSPGRMAPNAALNFLFLGGALLALEVRRGEWIVSILALAAAAVAMLALMGYAYGEDSLTGFVSYTHIAIHTAVAFVVLTVGVLFRLRDRGVTEFVMSDSPGGAMARSLLPPVFAVPLIFGWLRLLGGRAGLYGVEFGVELLVTASIVTLVVVVVRSAATLDKTDVERKRAEEALRESEEKLRISEERFRQLFEQNEEPQFLFRGGARRSSTSIRRPSRCTATLERSCCAAASPCSFRRRIVRSSSPPFPASSPIPS